MDNNFTPEIEVATNDKKAGLPLGISATAIGAIAYMLAFIGTYLFLFNAWGFLLSSSNLYLSPIQEAAINTALKVLIFAIVLAIPAIVAAIMAMMTYKKKKNSQTKPTMTLIFGIIGLVLSILTIVLSVIEALCAYLFVLMLA